METMSQNATVYFFGDQSFLVLQHLPKLLLVSKNPLTRAFLDEALHELRRCISTLPHTEQLAFPQIESLGLLVEAIQSGAHHAALDSVCLCIYQIAFYIEHITRNHLQHPPSQPSFFLGSCTGSLASAAISCSATISNVVQLGIEAVIIAFRLGMLVRQKSTILGYPGSRSWSAVISCDQSQEAFEVVEQFNSRQVRPLTSLPYISAVAPTAVTISGPPDVLDALLVEPGLSTKKSFHVPIYGPYHAGRLYCKDDLHHLEASIIGSLRFSDHTVNTPILLCDSASIIASATFGDALKLAISSILLKVMRLDHALEGLLEILTATNATTATLVSVASSFTASSSAHLSRKGITTHVDTTLEAAITAQTRNEATQSADSSGNRNKIAIVGFSGRFPDADGLAEFWDVLSRGFDTHKLIPADRFDVNTHFDSTGKRKNTSQVQYGCWLKDASLFDPRFFHLSPREATQTDPAQRLALLTAYEAIEMAGFVPDRTASSRRSRVGVYYGTTSNDWGEVNSSQNVDTYYIPGANRAFIPGRINYFFKFSGPSIAVDTACSSSLAAINIAVTSILAGDCDTAIAGGTNVITNPDNFAGLDRGHFLSRTGNCKTFDNDADGYCRADGVGTVILKRLSDAISDNDPVFGVILGAHTNHSAESVSITRPLADAQEHLFINLLNACGVQSHDVSYVEMHGTGTQAGDAVEMRSVLRALACDMSRPRNKKLFLGSVKANVGHGESASGVTALIKVLLMMKMNQIPPHCGIKTRINDGFPKDLAERGVEIVLAPKGANWPRPGGLDGKRRAFVNNFSAAGGNTAILIEDAPVAKDRSSIIGITLPDVKHVVTVSTRSNNSLHKNILNLVEYLNLNTATNAPLSAQQELLAQIAYTTTSRRIHHPYRVVVVADSLEDLKRSLSLSASRHKITKPILGKQASIGFIFTGQGAQETAMAHGLYNAFEPFRTDINDFDAMSQTQGFPSIMPLVNGSVPVEELSPSVIQLGTCIIQIALVRLWNNFGLKPQYVLGHSLGEYAALYTCGVLSISDTIYLCGRRALLVEKHLKPFSHGMLVVLESESNVREVIATIPSLAIACLNGPKDNVISGPINDIEAICEKFKELKYKFHSLVLPFAFHSSQMDPILDDLEDLAHQVEFRAPIIPFISTLLGTVVTSPGMIGPAYIRRHSRDPVNFLGAVLEAEHHNLIQRDVSACVEIGSHALLTRMMRNIFGAEVRCLASLRRGEEWYKTLPDAIAALHLDGMTINWEEYHRGHCFSTRKVVELPNYAWDLSSHWMQYEHDWCLTKGDAPILTSAVSSPADQGQPVRLSDSCQEILELSISDDKSSIVIQSDFLHPGLLPVAEQHRVNGLTLCPSTLYADVAFTLCKHLLDKRFSGEQEYMPDICNMNAAKALVISHDADAQLFRADLAVDWGSMAGSMELYSVDSSGRRGILHATCNIELNKPKVYEEYWQRHFYLIERSIRRLEESGPLSGIHKIGRGMAYKLFASSVQYSNAYQGIQEVCFDSEGLEATARVFSISSGIEGQFALNPYCCDSLGHISGFVMNSNDRLDLTENIYVNHGWRHMRFSEPYKQDVQYCTYVKMQQVGKDESIYSGDVYVLKDGRIVGLCEEVTFQKVPRKVLSILLPSASMNATTKKGSIPPTALVKARGNLPAITQFGGMSTLRPSPTCEMGSRSKASPELPEQFASETLQQYLQVIADEIGVSLSQLEDDTEFADLGVDSLMSLTILGIFREDFDLDVPASLFIDYPNVLSIKSLLLALISPSVSTICTTATSLSNCSNEALDEVKPLPQLDIPMSTSVVLQGTKSSPKTLFLFPDGAGSATSYVTLPPISPLLRVYGLNSPYLKHPQDFQCGLGDITESYLVEIRRRQPKGPYNFAGWSAGGVSAFDAAQKLIAEGEIVESLILIDSPNPVGLGKLPPKMYTFLENSGVFGAFVPSGSDPISESNSGGVNEAPAWLYQHFLVFIEALDKYRPIAFHREKAPKTTIIWAKDGVCKNPESPRPEAQPDDPRGMSWLLENRTDFGPNGWEEFLGEDQIVTHAIGGANHFTMMRAPFATAVVELLRVALDIQESNL